MVWCKIIVDESLRLTRSPKRCFFFFFFFLFLSQEALLLGFFFFFFLNVDLLDLTYFPFSNSSSLLYWNDMDWAFLDEWRRDIKAETFLFYCDNTCPPFETFLLIFYRFSIFSNILWASIALERWKLEFC